MDADARVEGLGLWGNSWRVPLRGMLIFWGLVFGAGNAEWFLEYDCRERGVCAVMRGCCWRSRAGMNRPVRRVVVL